MTAEGKAQGKYEFCLKSNRLPTEMMSILQRWQVAARRGEIKASRQRRKKNYPLKIGLLESGWLSSLARVMFVDC